MTAEERRARLGRRHALAPGHAAADPVGAARAVVALHSTDPASTVLSALARAPGTTAADVERALYDDRDLLRVLAMRRTLFAVPHDLAATALAAAGDTVAAQQRRLLHQLLVASGVTDAPEPWVARAERALLDALASAGEATAPELAAADALLAQRVTLERGTRYETTQSVASRLLTVLSAEGRVLRGRQVGGWATPQFRWTTPQHWRDLGPAPATADAAAVLAERWLRAYGPARPADLQWWAGWTVARTRAALAALDTVDVVLEDGAPGLLLADDADAVAPPDPWVALLPALDPTAMGWKHRDPFLGAHREQVYDRNGNAGPTVWVDGRVVGGWVQRADGEVVVELLDDVGREAAEAVTERAAALTASLGDVRLAARARGWTAVERRLRA
ncbi:winged helix DNA-binding domain-containing protein [Cellulomonas shaoxiangyii]|uniref:Winged helix DNA-binding domain-containing protein n=1 Tax=Cellulomonas shaoxiangyii TaxID=2566013 RepID=A0A4P7SLE4_9CELL|nr:winged helix DNA-binding domain-containing protein [Cellulomonas shaoxiangyii]TGY85476.1 winged helix DNA-binding domain-containing protein [Cellulomonas shaoxiangyii]